MIGMWVVTLTYDLTLDQTEYNRLADQLDQVDAGLFSLPGGRASVTYWAEGPDPISAAAVAHDHVTPLVGHEPLAVDVVTEKDHERRADAPTLPRLVSAPEVAEMLDVSRQRVHQLRSSAGFPAPLFELRTGAIWDARAVEKFAREWARRPGRPARRAG